ncbi:MAG: alpha-amylase family glycosyl hydrolase [Terracidiphilus sp.]|nr:alpha-amylase family glycosyl hydrolase [Terracidiphilus sp.]
MKAGTLLALAPSFPMLADVVDPSHHIGRGLARHTSAIQPPAPEWMKELVIYEIATKGFTSPNGPESGTFKSLRAKLPYLQELGINGLWLTGYSLCDAKHFYNIWTQYAVIEPNKFDPTLGTANEFKRMIDEAHRRRIRVFLDVITHGLMKDSSIIQEHPHWFRGESWGMTDFDWTGGHTDLDDWWVKIYSDFVTAYGVDGYRLDVDIYRPDLWERIRQNATAAGHPIVIWEEVRTALPGVTDFTQKQNTISTDQSRAGVLNEILVNDLPGFYERKFGRAGFYQVEVHYKDGEIVVGDTTGDGRLGVHLRGLTSDRVGRSDPQPDGLPDICIRLENLSSKHIANITVRNEMAEVWQQHTDERGSRPLVVDSTEIVNAPVGSVSANLYLSTLEWGSSIQLSCHDDGWELFPEDKRPYVAQGSRALFGYSFLFSPMIPIFFAGEEFDASFHALPTLSPHLYGGKDAGKGRWLYGCMLDWNELREPEHQAMLTDVRKMLALRNRYSKILSMVSGGQMPNLKAVSCTSEGLVPVPYLRWDEHSAILICANRSRERDAHLKLKIDLAGTTVADCKSYLVSDLWSTAQPITMASGELSEFDCTVKQDGIGGGGLAVFWIHPA